MTKDEETLRRAAVWLATGQVGASSRAMCCWLVLGIAPKSRSDYPLDPADFDRCLQFLGAVPEARQMLTKMREVSKPWSALVDRWDELEQCHLDEVGLGWSKAHSAPRTYALMKSILTGAGW